jgi:hypothetical protein
VVKCRKKRVERNEKRRHAEIGIEIFAKYSSSNVVSICFWIPMGFLCLGWCGYWRLGESQILISCMSMVFSCKLVGFSFYGWYSRMLVRGAG